MDVAWVVAAVAAAVVATAMVTWLIAHPRSWTDRAARSTVVVHLDDGTSLRGVLDSTSRDGLVLYPAEILRAAGPTPVAGHALIGRGRVAWVQHVPALDHVPTVGGEG